MYALKNKYNNNMPLKAYHIKIPKSKSEIQNPKIKIPKSKPEHQNPENQNPEH